MKKLILFTLALLFTGIISSCKKEHKQAELSFVHLYANGFKRDLGSAD
ncbi:hypothetical protein SNE25_23730 [Mucilaginibacter sabulilitoris]|uniref:Uncharacterized protein n=1 Tax=Mucilaginibacter sabulilitoris TaxID=1173583 RepID=A0ABZ0TGM8_9SPHI|nr:hypothetical protein [Mucilaginibacter sabulilitoris]WPU92339.1 hypothetical protein SNE25_23730 [Mucilaginibacter sabulilitoris]